MLGGWWQKAFGYTGLINLLGFAMDQLSWMAQREGHTVSTSPNPFLYKSTAMSASGYPASLLTGKPTKIRMMILFSQHLLLPLPGSPTPQSGQLSRG